MRRATWVWLAAALGCSGPTQDTKVETQVDAAASAQPEAARPGKRDSVPMVEADIGSLDEAGVKAAFGAARDAMTECLKDANRRAGYLYGDVEVAVRVAKDGAVTSAMPSESTLGDRTAEKCMVDAAARQKFPKAQGGKEAIARQRMGITARGRAAEQLGADQLGPAGAQLRAALGRCAKGVTVTVYVDPDGKPVGAGAAAAEPEGASGLDCAVAAAMKLRFPSPGSWMGKVTVAP
jgi:outer membrane biosynthesis protein TonB